MRPTNRDGAAPGSGVNGDAADGPAIGDLTEAALTACVEAAIAAPSIHNSQPWQFRFHDGGIDVYADFRRRLERIDPSGRELLISIGAAVFNLRLAMHQQARVPVVLLYPEPAEPHLVARVKPGGSARPDPPLDALARVIPLRHTNRRPFASVPIPGPVLEELVAEAKSEGATLRVADTVGRNAILGLVRTAEQRLRSQGIYRAELPEWTVASHSRHDPLPPRDLGSWDALEALPLRDFGLTQPQLRHPIEPAEPYPAILVLSTDGDDASQWVTSGQALQRVLLRATVHNLAATPMTQPLEIPAVRELVTDTSSDQWAQVILRLGYAPPTIRAPRRPLADVLLPRSS